MRFIAVLVLVRVVVVVIMMVRVMKAHVEDGDEGFEVVDHIAAAQSLARVLFWLEPSDHCLDELTHLSRARQVSSVQVFLTWVTNSGSSSDTAPVKAGLVTPLPGQRQVAV